MQGKWYQPHEFARVVGMTKRALRYYREKKILIPDYINEEGHCFYSENNFYQAQQIATLRYLGFNVEEIRGLQDKQRDIGSSLTLQKNLLKEKLLETQRLITAIENIEAAIQNQDDIPWNRMFETIRFTKHAAVESSMMEYYDARAEEYEKIFIGEGPASCKSEVYKKDVSELFKFLSGFGQGKVIDIGCGTGYWLKGYYKNSTAITFLDASIHMLQKCQEKVIQYDLEKCSDFVQTDFLKWKNCPSHEYDGAIAGFVLGHFMSTQETEFFHKVREILKPGGKILLIDNTWSKWRAVDEHKEDIEKRQLLDGREFLIYKKYFEEDELRKIFEKYQIQVENVYWGLNFFGMIGKVL